MRTPEDIFDAYGVDAARLFVMSDSPPERDVQWTEAGIEGASRFQQRIWKLAQESIEIAGLPPVGETPAAEQDFLAVLQGWTRDTTTTLPEAPAMFLRLLCCLEDDDRIAPVIGGNWADVWRRLQLRGDPPPLEASLWTPLAERALVQLAYAIGVADPVSVMVRTEGTGRIPEEKITELVRANFKLTPRGIGEELNLRRPIYKLTAAFGHFGRTDDTFTWEKTDKATALASAAEKLAVAAR